MKPVKYHRLAENEMVKSARFYDQRREFLGDRFLDRIEESLVEIQAHPEMGKPGRFRTRSWRLRQFPFRLVYLEQSDRIWIVAVAHLSRKPGYWLERLEQSRIT